MEVSIMVRWDKLDGSPVELRPLVAERRGEWLCLIGGPTGYEQLRPTDPALAQAIADGRDWIANFGTPGRYAQVIVPFDEVAQAVAKLW